MFLAVIQKLETVANIINNRGPLIFIYDEQAVILR